MKLSQRLQDEKAFVETECQGIICDRCGAHLSNYGWKCEADLSDLCQGFQAIEAAKTKFNQIWLAEAEAEADLHPDS